MSHLFSCFNLKNRVLKNRLMRSATTSFWSDDDGVLRNSIVEYYQRLVKGGIGFIVKGHSYVIESGKAHVGQSGLTNEKHIPKMKKITTLAHSEDIPIIAQLNHGGYWSINERITASEYKTGDWVARKATIDDIELIIESFANASEIAMLAGFDGVQIHGAHGYLVNQFLSDKVNRRDDKYGGSLKARTKILFDIFDAIKKKIGNAPIISTKLNCDDFAPTGGIQISDSVLITSWLDEKGIDFIEISGGGPEKDNQVSLARGKAKHDSPYFEAHFAGHTEIIRKVIPSVPLALVNGFRTFNAMEKAIEHSLVDLISISRPTIIEPDFPNKLKAHRQTSKCSSCSKCISKERFGKMMLSCVHLNE